MVPVPSFGTVFYNWILQRNISHKNSFFYFIKLIKEWAFNEPLINLLALLYNIKTEFWGVFLFTLILTWGLLSGPS